MDSQPQNPESGKILKTFTNAFRSFFIEDLT